MWTRLNCKVAGKLSIRFSRSLACLFAYTNYLALLWHYLVHGVLRLLLIRITEELFIHSLLPLFMWQIFVEHLYQALFQACWCSGKNTSIILALLEFRVKTKLRNINNHNNKITTNLTKENKMLWNRTICVVSVAGANLFWESVSISLKKCYLN